MCCEKAVAPRRPPASGLALRVARCSPGAGKRARAVPPGADPSRSPGQPSAWSLGWRIRSLHPSNPGGVSLGRPKLASQPGNRRQSWFVRLLWLHGADLGGPLRTRGARRSFLGSHPELNREADKPAFPETALIHHRGSASEGGLQSRGPCRSDCPPTRPSLCSSHIISRPGNCPSRSL